MAKPNTNTVDFGYLNDKKLEKGKKATLDQVNQWKGPSHKERQAEKQESKKKIQKAQHDKAERASWKKQVGGLCAILVMCGAGLFSFLMTVMDFIRGNGVQNLDEKDTATLKQVLFGGDPWLVYCVNNDTVNQRLPKVLEESANTLRSNLGVSTGVLKCWDQMESGRSVVERFKLKLSPPLNFLVANGNKPRIVDLVGVSKAEDLEKKLKPALKVDAPKVVNNLKAWSSSCTSRRSCIVVGHKWPAEKDAAVKILRPLLEKHRAVKVVTLDTTIWQLKLDEEVMGTRRQKEKGEKTADILCLARKEGTFPDNATHVGRFLDSLDASSAASFLTACVKQERLVPIGVAPRINKRPPKKPKVVTPEPYKPSASPSPRPPPPPPKKKKVDAVGSRARMEQEDEALFEAIDEEEEEESSEEDQAEEDEEEQQPEAEEEGQEVEL